jgi:hypothetical protein
MASFIGGPALQAISAYNPVYWYADSSNKGLEGFRYVLKVEKFNPPGNNFEVLAELEIPPRFGDGLLEVDLAKVLQSRLGFAPDNFDLNANNTIWLNGSAAGYEYRVTLGERYLYEWPFVAWGTQNGNLVLIQDAAFVAPTYQPGDIINVTGVTEEFEYTSITNNGGFAQFNFTGPHTFALGDRVNVRQDSPVSFLAYSVPSIVTGVATNSITVNIPFAGTPYQTQTGSAFRNLASDGFKSVISVTVSGPFRLVELDFPASRYDGFSALNPGITSYADGRLVSTTDDLSGGAVFNGAVTHQEWPTFPFVDYWYFPQPTSTQRFLTSAPDGFCVRPENEFYLNFFTRTNLQFQRLRVVTRDPAGAELGRYWFERDISTPAYQSWSASTFQGGEGWSNVAHQVVVNGGLLDGSSWQVQEFLGAVGTFTLPGFNYLDNTGNGDGTVILEQPNILTPGNEYVVTIRVLNNNFVQALVGDENDTYQILNNQNGTFSLNFTATGTDFFIELNSNGGVTQGVDVLSISVKTQADILDCQVGDFDVTLTREDLVNIIQNGRFETTDDWVITNQLGGVAQIAGGVLNYLDNTGNGDGTSLVVQAGALVPGTFYTVTIDSTNNNFAQVLVGDENDTYQILNNQNGTFSVTFTATGTDFYIEINSNGGVTQGVDLDNLTVRTTQDVAMSESRRFSVCCACDGRYENVEMLFADRLGSILPFNFSLNQRRRLNDITRATFKQQIGAYKPGQVFGKYTYSTAEHSDKAYHTELTQQWTINTDWMDEPTSKFFEQVTTNPRCWIKIEGQWVAVHVIDRVHDIKLKNNRKNIMYTLTVQFSTNDSVQGC